MACGIPVMGSRVDGGREALLDGTLGELVDPSRPEEVRAGVVRTLQRGRGRLRGLEQFSREAFGRRVDALIGELLRSRLRQRGSARAADAVGGALLSGHVPRPHSKTEEAVLTSDGR